MTAEAEAGDHGLARRVATLSALMATGLALAGCAGDSGDENPTRTVVETVTVPEAKSAEPRKASPTRQRTEAGTTTDADPRTPTTDKSGPSPQADSPNSRSTAKAPATAEVPADEVQATNRSAPEVTLAVIDAESASVKKSTVSRYAVLLDTLEAACRETRSDLAGAALQASEDTGGGGNGKVSILVVLQEVAASNPPGECASVFDRVARRRA